MKPLKLRGRLLAPLAVAVAAGLALLIGSALLPSGRHDASAAFAFDPNGVVCIDINDNTIFPGIPREVKTLARFEHSKKDPAKWDVTQFSVVGDTNSDGIPDTVPTTQDCPSKTEPGVLTPGVTPLGGGPAGRPSATVTKKGNTLVWEVCSFETNYGWVLSRFSFDVTGLKDLDGATGTNTTWLNANACVTETATLAPTFVLKMQAVQRATLTKPSGPLTATGNPGAGLDWDGDGCTDYLELDPSPFDRRGVDPFDATDCYTSAAPLAGVFDAMTHLGGKAIDANHCIVRIDHNPATNELWSQAQCFDNLGTYTFGSNDEPINDPPGEGQQGDALGIGPPPPPPYSTYAPGQGKGTYNPGTLTAVTTTCFGNLGGPRGPNVIWLATIVDPIGQLATTGKITGTVAVYFNQSSGQCKSAEDGTGSDPPKGTPIVLAYNGYAINDSAACPASNCVQAPWRTAGDQDWDNDGCDDWQELHSSRGAPCGDDPWNPNDPTGPTLDVSGNYTILATAAQAEVCKNQLPAACTGQPDGTLAPGFYYSCVADVQQSGKNLTARVFCYIDFPGITIGYEASGNNATCPPAPANRCGDGLAGGAPPGITVTGGPRLFDDPGLQHTVLTGTLNNNTNNLELAGCFKDEDGTGALGNVIVRAKINAHTGHGSVTLWTGQTNANCVAGTPVGAGGPIPIDLVKEAPKAANRDRDSDGCPDKQELGDAAGQGGLRDPSNHYDYMNASNDGQNRVSDILVVVGQYFIDDLPGPIDYKSQTDRTGLVGGNAWNLGPPNGTQRVEDILFQVKQYFHDCGGGAIVQPGPTPTPGGPTPTPPGPQPAPGLDFSIGIDANGDTADDCNTKGGPAKCTLPPSSTFTVRAYLNSLPNGVPSYEGFDVVLQHAGVGQSGLTSSVHQGPGGGNWPGCVFTAAAFPPSEVAFGCSIGLGAPASTYTGQLGAVDFNCDASGSVSMEHGAGNTALAYAVGLHHQVDTSPETLTINCIGGDPPQVIGALGVSGNKATIQAGSTIRWVCDPGSPTAQTAIRFFYDWPATGPATEDVTGTGAVTFTHVPPANVLNEVRCIVDNIPGAPLIISWLKLVDPSGKIIDGPSGLAIPEATVYLQIEDPADSGTYHNFIPGTDPLKDPLINPEYTGLDGRYAWDVSQTHRYRVVASRATCTTVTSPAVLVGPPVTDLDIALTCPDSNSNGIPDILEQFWGIPNLTDDTDMDTLSNLDELNFGTNPLVPDNVDGDGDGCVNLKKVSLGNYEGELSSSALTGGRRDGANQWDFFDPDKSVGSERIHRVGDILAVGNHYHLNDADYNRSYVGPNDWNLGPPDGLINVEDILFARSAYFNDCP